MGLKPPMLLTKATISSSRGISRIAFSYCSLA
jgi:hypothetical protein